MIARLLLAGLLMLSINVSAQKDLPFHPHPISLHIPTYMPGIMEDSVGETKNDTLTYHLHGEVFHEGLKISLNKAYDNKNPWTLLARLVKAYAEKNKEKVLALYNKSSQESVKSLLYGEDAESFLNYASKIAQANLRIVSGFNYQGGFVTVCKDDWSGGMNVNYMIKEKDGYRLSSFRDKSPTIWNALMYFKFSPVLPVQITSVEIADSLQFHDSVLITVALPYPKWWATVYYGKSGAPVHISIQDGGETDLNSEPGKVAFYLKGEIFSEPGKYMFYTTAFNYPVERISSGFISSSAAHNITIYE